MPELPLLVFPRPREMQRPTASSGPRRVPHFPDHDDQVERLSPEIEKIPRGFELYKASIGGSISSMEPETVLVIEIAGAVDDFKRAVEATEGLEWIGEWYVEDIEPDELFYLVNSRSERTDRPLPGRLFVSMSNERGLQSLLANWERYEKEKPQLHRQTKWRDVFSQTIRIRRWGVQDTLRDTGMIHAWRDLLNPVDTTSMVRFEIEFFYRKTPDKRAETEHEVTRLLAEIGGRTISPFLDLPDIRFHAVKAEVPPGEVRRLLRELEHPETSLDIRLFLFHGVMYFRPTGQAITVPEEESGETELSPETAAEGEPVIAILDGVPNLQHDTLKHHLVFDDPDLLLERYQPGERRHGTSMASLVIHGDRNIVEAPLQRKVYHRPVMQPDEEDRINTLRGEHCPDDVFLEDRIERAVRRMLVGEGATPPQAPGVKIVNLSIGNRDRPFTQVPSPLARLIDWLSWRYRVLFLVSAGNYWDDIDLAMSQEEFTSLTEDHKVTHTIRRIAEGVFGRRLLSPAESTNALTIGALHADASGQSPQGNQVDIMPSTEMFSPIGRFGHGVRRAIKPEILFPGGRQLYSGRPGTSQYWPVYIQRPTGQKVAWDSAQLGETSAYASSCGTSNATALATRSAGRIHEVLSHLQAELGGQQIPDELMAVTIKTLLVHGARLSVQVQDALKGALRTERNAYRFKEIVARFMGYGSVDIERVMGCTEQRCTVLGCGEIERDQVHEYRFPLPVGLSGQTCQRRMVVTLAWLSPINPAHRNLREAKLEFKPICRWGALPLRLSRQDSDSDQVTRGTVQHEVLEGHGAVSAYEQDGQMLLRITCTSDAGDSLDDRIPYGLAITLEVAEATGIPIYQQIRSRIREQIAVQVSPVSV